MPRACTPDAGYRLQRVAAQEPDDRMFVHVAFSGGGARAAALGFGVLEALRETPIVFDGKAQRLIDLVDLMMGVSGGSVIAAKVGGVSALVEGVAVRDAGADAAHPEPTIGLHP